MICCTVTGYLAAPPKSAFKNATGEVFRIRLGTNHNQYDSKTKTWHKQTIWCSGLVSDKKIGAMMPFFVKGAPLVVSASDCCLNHYTSTDGSTKCDLDLGYIDRVEAYQRLPKAEMTAAHAGVNTPHYAAAASPQQEAVVSEGDDSLPPLL